MSRLAAIQTQSVTKPVRVMIYGIEGVGKSSFGAKAPHPIFISPEGGTDELRDREGKRIAVMPGIHRFDDIKDAVKELILTEKHGYETLVLDSADWIEKLCHAQIVGSTGRSITTVNGGYGAGYRESEQMHRALIEQLSELREKRNMNIVVTAHYQVRTVKDPESVQDYDAFEIKCHEMVSSLWREWVDALLFARFRTYLQKNDDKDKGRAMGDGKRVMYTEKRPAYQAKNRYGLPSEIDDVSWDLFYSARMKGSNPEDPKMLLAEINSLWVKIQDKSLQDTVAKHVSECGGDVAKLSETLNRLRKLVTH